MLEIERRNPDVGYVDEDVFRELHFVQTIRAGNALYVSGTAPYVGGRGGVENAELVGKGDLEKQTDWTMQVLERCLDAYGATFWNWVYQTVYTTDIQKLAQVAHVFDRYFGEHVPTSTWVQAQLIYPEQMIEINGIAILE